MNETKITYVGHATTLIETGKTRILTDPLLRNRLSFLLRQKYPIKQDWFESIDVVLVSHKHLDHFDIYSLGLLDSSTRILAPEDVVQHLRIKGFRNAEVAKVGSVVDVGEVSLRVVAANHHGRLKSLKTSKSNPVGYLIEGAHKIYFPGDTDLFEDMINYGESLDVALMPVWGWGPTLGPGHLNPRRAAQALQLLRPRVAIPIHWGTFSPFGIGWLKPGYLVEPPREFANHAAKLAPDVKVRILQPGEHTCLEE